MITSPLFPRGTLLLAAFISSPVPPVEGSLSVFRGAPRNGGVFDAISYDNPGDESFNEHWQLTAHLDDGSLLSIFFAVHNAGPGDGHSGILLRYIPTAGKPIVKVIDSRAPTSGTGAFNVRFGQDFLARRGKPYLVSVRSPQVSFVGSMDPLAPSYVAGDGKILDERTKKYFSWEAIVPRGHLRGELSTGDTRREVNGYAYLDHSEATLPVPDVSRAWRSLRLHTQEWTVNLLAIDGLPTSGSSPLALVQLVDANGLIRASADCTLSGEWSRVDTSGETAPAEWGFVCRFEEGRLRCPYRAGTGCGPLTWLRCPSARRTAYRAEVVRGAVRGRDSAFVHPRLVFGRDERRLARIGLRRVSGVQAVNRRRWAVRGGHGIR